MKRLPKKERQKQFKAAAYKRADQCYYRCQHCHSFINITGTWYTGDIWGDCNYFAHIRGRNHLNDTEYINHFLFICRELHFHQTYNKGWEDHPCVKDFLKNYFTDYKHFYRKFIEVKGKQTLYLDYE
jgi:hypothetical protein